MTLAKVYREYRRKGWQAKWAIYAARTKLAWAEYEDDSVRLRIEPDDCSNLEDLLGDCFNPDVNTDIQRSRLERERQREIDRINADGVWGVIGEYLCPECGEWVHADSCWGFIGEDWIDSGYDIDIMSETLEKAGLLGEETKTLAESYARFVGACYQWVGRRLLKWGNRAARAGSQRLGDHRCETCN